MGGDQVVVHVPGVAGGVADAVQALDPGQLAGQPSQAALTRPGVDVLPQEGDLAHAAGGQAPGLGQDGLGRPGPFAASGVGHHAEGAELVAALLDGEEGGDARGRALGAQCVELGLGGEVSGETLSTRPVGAGDQLGQLVVGLGAHDEVDGGLTAQDLLALRLGHAAGDRDGHGPARRGPLGLQGLQLAQLGIDLLGRLLADMAGVQDDKVGLLRPLGHGVAQGRQNVRHALAVIDVHLAAIGADVEPPRGWGRGVTH